MTKKKEKQLLCEDNLRHNEYYGMQSTIDNLYQASANGEVFTDLKAVEAGCGDVEALLRTPKPVKSIYYDFKYYFDEYSYANCDLYVEKAIEVCGNNTLRKEFLRAKGWDALDDFDINDEEE